MPTDKIRTLVNEAYNLTLEDLNNFENKVSPAHGNALRAIMAGMAETAYKVKQGRFAYPLFMGGGKTSAVIAFVTTLHKLGYDKEDGISVVVSASKVAALEDLKRALISHGVPAEKVGLIHSYRYDPKKAEEGEDGYASEEATKDNETRPFILVTHSRIKGPKSASIYNTYLGEPRSLVIWDEGLVKSEATAIKKSELKSQIMAIRGFLDERVNSKQDEAIAYVENSVKLIEEDLGRQKDYPDADIKHLELEEREPWEIAEYREVFSDVKAREKKLNIDQIQAFLSICQKELRVFYPAKDVGGIITYDIKVPPELENIIILDASYEIRKLIQEDSSIKSGDKYESDLVSYYDSTVRYINFKASRTAITKEFRKRNFSSKLLQEFAGMLKRRPENEGNLIFIFKQRSPHDPDFKSIFEEYMERAGIEDVNATLVETGKPRYNFLTHGNYTSANKYSYCTNVFFIGVLHQSRTGIASQVAAQREDVLTRISHKELDEIYLAEILYGFQQGAGRTAIRIVKNGLAEGVNIVICYPNLKDIQGPLFQIFPKIGWDEPNLKLLKPTKTKTSECIEKLQDALAAVTGKISISKLKKLAGLEALPIRTFQIVRDGFLESNPMWVLDGRSLVLRDFDYCFK